MPVRKPKHDNKHLTFQEREIIQLGIEKRSSKADIARTIAKDPTTIAKEIRTHRIFKPRNTFNNQNICIHLNNPCKKCISLCEKFEAIPCKFRDRTPGACNGYDNMKSCRLDKYLYDAKKAQQSYETTLVEAREGFNLTQEEIVYVGSIIAPLLNRGQSIYTILNNHPEINLSAKSLYTYIEAGIFKSFGIDNFSLKEQVNRKFNKPVTKKRKDPVFYDGRRYKDFLIFLEENPDATYVELDTLYNSPSGPFIQTIIFPTQKLMVGFYHDRKTSESMAKTFDTLESNLGIDIFTSLFEAILTDRGTEFETYSLFESSCILENFTRTRMFYCDPQNSSQKPFVENNHNYVRDVLPNGLDLSFLTQDKLNLMFSHINSVPRKSLGNKTPYELFEFTYGKKILDTLQINKVPADEVTLKSFLVL